MYEGEIAIGPIHSAILEPHRLRLFIEDEIIKDAELTIGVNHRGIERLMEGLPPEKATILTEKICGICSHIHLWSAVRVCEIGSDIEVPERANHIRVIVEELERLHSHTLLFGHAFEILGHETMSMRAFMLREPIMQTLFDISGSRVQYSCPIIGGIRPRCDIKDSQISAYLERMEKYEDALNKIIGRTINDPLLVSRMKDIGVLDRKTAAKYHALGPTARGSGIKSDMRKMGYVPEYDCFEFDEIILDDGDVYARVAVRFYECIESVKIIKQALKELPSLPEKFYNPNYEIKEFKPIDCYTEAQRGQQYYTYGVDNEGRVRQAKVRTPTATNLACMEEVLKDYHVSDAELIVASCDPCFTCTDRLIILREQNNK
ncbi:hydrogenase large subunit [Methanococcus aeolicus]|uniref:NADH dehydrogenase (Quinone) n=1 Tax=Methanococcus aeolicus (strain ATCC BAA-1280 / DSM 17508 / OCM 812 / Nankai-3) TaxID=419665 RepID=A6UTS2_META3|nr:nickel-dependent hydrogenase large subunit [Methanococcus aeolicus]ABR55894.1 NADH dehydrogenase (quinone) [Methanococcus aeolicus Nankai-3]UXM84001.1 nickel-dependent hydrogenase large subunit [Methanococcus aeolicus]